MTMENLQKAAAVFMDECPDNYISKEDAVREDLVGMRIFEAPIFAVGGADDPLFRELQAPGVVGPETLLPTDWIPDAQSVLSYFLPFTARVRDSNRLSPGISDEWRHARIEGQMMSDKLGVFLCQLLEKEGFAAAYPAADARFHWVGPVASNWSERHVAYVCGLGTFGISRGLITKRGTAGRFGSVVTNASLPVTPREYDGPFAYCTMCGECQDNCPAGAIDIRKGVVNGKDQGLCSEFCQKGVLPPHGPHQRVRFGCGKCQVGVPCETGIPGRNQE